MVEVNSENSSNKYNTFTFLNKRYIMECWFCLGIF